MSSNRSDLGLATDTSPLPLYTQGQSVDIMTINHLCLCSPPKVYAAKKLTTTWLKMLNVPLNNLSSVFDSAAQMLLTLISQFMINLD